MTRRTGNGGMALISVVVSIAILAIALTMATSTFFSASRLMRQSADMSRASNFAEGVMERVTSQSFESISSREITQGLPDLPEAACKLDVTTPEAGLKQVVVKISWLQGEMPRSVAFSTLVAGGRAR